MIGIIRVLSASDDALLEEHGRILEADYDARTLSRCIPDQPHGIYDAITATRAVPKIVATARKLRTDGARAILISCAADPGLLDAQAAVDVPVFGAGSVSAGVALALDQPVGLLGITGQVPAPADRVLGSRILAHRQPEGVHNTADLLTESGKHAALKAVSGLLEAGAPLILFACTGLSTIGLAAQVRERYGCPVVDAVRTTGAVVHAAIPNGS